MNMVLADGTITITAYGIPGPQGSKRHVGRGIMVESSAKVKPWREAVKAAALDARQVCDCPDPECTPYPPIDAPVRLRMVFTLAKPASAPKRRRTWPMRTPDLSKLARATEDALTEAGIWRDDARVVEYERLAKVYPGEDPEALDVPGVRIVVSVIEETTHA
jgi:Holliday junction resolvase RusA-like endonuclease